MELQQIKKASPQQRNQQQPTDQPTEWEKTFKSYI